MTTITERTKQKTQMKPGKLMKSFISDHSCLSLLRFFIWHPNGRFSKLAIIHAVDDSNSRQEIEQALKRMVEEGVLMMNIENDVNFYWLTRESVMRDTIMEMAEFDWRHWQLVLEHM
jgi:hypothetical protein